MTCHLAVVSFRRNLPLKEHLSQFKGRCFQHDKPSALCVIPKESSLEEASKSIQGILVIYKRKAARHRTAFLRTCLHDVNCQLKAQFHREHVVVVEEIDGTVGIIDGDIHARGFVGKTHTHGRAEDLLIGGAFIEQLDTTATRHF